MYLVQYPTLGALFAMNSKPEWTEADKKYRSGDRKLGEEGGEANAEGGGGGGRADLGVSELGGRHGCEQAHGRCSRVQAGEGEQLAR